MTAVDNLSQELLFITDLGDLGQGQKTDLIKIVAGIKENHQERDTDKMISERKSRKHLIMRKIGGIMVTWIP